MANNEPGTCTPGGVSKHGPKHPRQQWRGRFQYIVPSLPTDRANTLAMKNVVVYAWSEREALDKMEARKTEIRDDFKTGNVDPALKAEWTVGDLFTEWLRYETRHQTFADATLVGVERSITILKLLLGEKTLLGKVLANHRLEEILNTCTCCRPRLERKQGGKPDPACDRCKGSGYAGATQIKIQIAHFNQALAYAAKPSVRKLEEAPRYKVYPHKPRGEAREFTDPEIEKLLASVAHDPQWLAFYYVMLLRGLRLGEILRLKWSDRIEPDVLHIHNPDTPGKSKTAAGHRMITLNRKAVDLLDRHRADQTQRKVQGNLIFPGVNGSKLLGGNFRKRYFYPLTERLELKTAGQAFTCHSFRHTAATRMEKSEVPVAVQLAELGHAPTKENRPGSAAASATYLHLQGDLPWQRKYAEKAGAWLNALLPRPTLKAVG